MKQRDVTQSGIAAHCRVAQSAVSNWLKGSMPGGVELVLLADYLRVAVEDLFEKQSAGTTETLREHPAEYLIDEVIAGAQEIQEMSMRLEMKAQKLKWTAVQSRLVENTGKEIAETRRDIAAEMTRRGIKAGDSKEVKPSSRKSPSEEVAEAVEDSVKKKPWMK